MRNLINAQEICEFCHYEVSLKKTKNNKEGYNWRCINKRYPHFKTTQSIRNLSFFKGIKTSIKKIVLCLLLYSTLSRKKDIVQQSGCSKNLVLKI
ncbi:hypothetical protein H312_00695 [Anncaliia algerae PRA339]|uniref:Uncharacterized protein n=1 Tax=Anncaliia algerae PRA339 TaxID=1288291 RepID=A0A059F3D4_9MICR|nr:hypothetical protein H312_00695 [Anncaliia algerae PRA339]